MLSGSVDEQHPQSERSTRQQHGSPQCGPSAASLAEPLMAAMVTISTGKCSSVAALDHCCRAGQLTHETPLVSSRQSRLCHLRTLSRFPLPAICEHARSQADDVPLVSGVCMRAWQARNAVQSSGTAGSTERGLLIRRAGSATLL